MSFSPFNEINNITLLGLFRLAVEKRSKAITDRNQNLRFRTMNTKFTRDLQIFLRKNREMYLAPNGVNPNATQTTRGQASQAAATGEPTAKRTRMEPASVNQGASTSAAVPPRPFKVPNILKRSHIMKRANTMVKPERGSLRK